MSDLDDLINSFESIEINDNSSDSASNTEVLTDQSNNQLETEGNIDQLESENNILPIDSSNLDLTAFAQTITLLRSQQNLNFSPLNIATVNLPVTMAQFKPEYLSCVPKFEGNPCELNRYLATCKSLIDNFYDTVNVNCFQNIFLINSLIGKLSGNARLVVNVQNVSTWDGLKNTLTRHFADRRDESCLNRDLVLTKQNANETPQSYYDRILELLNLLCSYVDAHDDVATAQIKRNLYTELALKTFLAGLREPLGNTIRCMSPKDLADAIQLVIRESNTKYFQNQPNHNNSNANHTKPKPQQHQFRFNGPTRNFGYNNYTPNQFKQPFPSQPINIRPNANIRPQKFFSNSQVFGKPKPTNVFRQNPGKILPKPTPMSGVSFQNTQNFTPVAQASNFQQPQQQYQQQPKYAFEELFTTELDPTSEEYQYSYSNVINQTYPENNANYDEQQIYNPENSYYYYADPAQINYTNETQEEPTTSNQAVESNFQESAEDNQNI